QRPHAVAAAGEVGSDAGRPRHEPEHGLVDGPGADLLRDRHRAALAPRRHRMDHAGLRLDHDGAHDRDDGASADHPQHGLTLDEVAIGSRVRARMSEPMAAEIAPTFKKSVAREYLESVVVAIMLALFIRTFIVQAFKIPTGSMENNLLIGDHLLVNKLIFGPTPLAIGRALLPVRAPRRGDIVVFKYPDEPDRDFIKRIIGLPGETVELRNKKVS